MYRYFLILAVALWMSGGSLPGMAQSTSSQPYTGHVQKQHSEGLGAKAKHLGHKVGNSIKQTARRPGVKRTAAGAAIGAGVGVVTSAGVLPAAVTGAAIGTGYHYAKKHHVGQKLKNAVQPNPKN